MAVNIHFLTNPAVIEVLQSILDVAGPNFSPPYDSSLQPLDGNGLNNEDLIQFQLPGGSSIKGYSAPGKTEQLSDAINSMLSVFAPFISAYAMILPILGIIRGILEVICALMNPFAVARAVKRLFQKWIPAFISLFPPLAGVVIVLSIIKTIIAVMLFILTVVIPMIELIIYNIKIISEAYESGADKSDQRIKAGRDKLKAILAELIQQSGILSVLQPLLEIIFSILQLSFGFPCKKKNKKDANGSTGTLFSPLQVPDGDDSSCCDDLCPEILSDKSKLIKGTGVLVQSKYCDYAPLFVFKLLTNNNEILKLEQYIQSKELQLEGCLDEKIRFARPAGASQDTSLIKVKITGRRGGSKSIIVPVLDISGTSIKIVSPLARLFVGSVNYEIIPDYDMLVMSGVIGISCHPDIKEVAENVGRKFSGVDDSFLDKFPFTRSIPEDYNRNTNDYNKNIERIGQIIDSLGLPPFDAQIDELDGIRDNIVESLNNFINDMKNRMNGIISNAFDVSSSSFDVSKSRVKADNLDKSIITIIPRDITGSFLLKNVPSGVSLNVDILTTFGTISNKTVNNSTGAIEAEILSPLTGVANITVKINGQFITEPIVEQSVVKVKTVEFVSESILPTRRKKSKVSDGLSSSTGTNVEKSPRK